jgi:hypothetical protein
MGVLKLKDKKASGSDSFGFTFVIPVFHIMSQTSLSWSSHISLNKSNSSFTMVILPNILSSSINLQRTAGCA